MKKAILAGLLGIALVLPSLSASAGHGGRFSHRGYGGHYRYSSDGVLIATGIIGGAILLGALLSRPSYAHHHTYYAPPPAYRPPPPYRYYGQRCYQDRVWRTLPDGRTQTGTRTTCY